MRRDDVCVKERKQERRNTKKQSAKKHFLARGVDIRLDF